ncbi:MAG: DUF4352 domain-containing protein [Bifidobacteriaceae bacterium]|jgi:hypothetical protein|nr:DUF4352 domain-containing protein [Bifidobacteriaceae bacterium]
MLSKKISVLVSAVAMLLLAGCGSTGAATQHAPQKTMTISEAADYYTKTITPDNEAVDKYNDAIASGDIPTITKEAGNVAKSNKATAKRLKVKVWPKDARKYVDAIAEDLDASAKLYEKTESAATLNDIQEIWGGYVDNGAAASLRKILGLKSAEMESAAHVGDTQTDGKLRMKINSAEKKSSILYDTCGDGCSNKEYAAKGAGQGKKYFVVNATITNNSNDSIDLTCDLPLAIKAINDQNQNFDPIQDLYQVKGNPECNAGLQPGQSASVEYPFEVSTSDKITALSWQDTTYMEQGGGEPPLAYFDLTE